MDRQYFFTDKWDYSWKLIEPLVMGYLDHPMVELVGHGSFSISPDAFEAFAIEYLRAAGFTVVAKEDLTGERWIGGLRDTLTTVEQRLGNLEEGMERLGPIIGARKRGSDE